MKKFKKNIIKRTNVVLFLIEKETLDQKIFQEKVEKIKREEISLLTNHILQMLIIFF